MKLLVTGGAGFIGSNFVRYWLKNYPEDQILNLDVLTYAGNLENLSDVVAKYSQNYIFIKGDIGDAILVNNLLQDHQPDIIVNFAAESHNSYAILNPSIFTRTNVLGTQTLLEAARKHHTPRLHHISTCEVYGDLALGSPEKFTEQTPYRPNTPYNASKAAADLIVKAYFKTFQLPVTISSCCNNYGPYQFPEKLIPLFVTNLLNDTPITLYEQSENRREWLHVLDHCRAIDLILKQGKIGEIYNVGSGIEKSVEDISAILLKELNKPETLKTYVEDRPAHDRRYLLDSSKIRAELNWEPKIDFDAGIHETVQWYKNNPSWWKSLKERNTLNEAGWKQQSKD